MGRTVPSFRLVVATEKSEWKTFRNALDKSERKEFAEMWDIPKLYVLIISFSPNVGEVSLDTLIKDKSKVHTTMITPKLTAVMVAMTALVGSGPIAAFAQLDIGLETGDADNEAVANTGGNSIDSVTVGNQEASNTIAVVQSNEATATGGDAEAEAESDADARSGDVKKSKNGKSSADAASEAIALLKPSFFLFSYSSSSRVISYS
jgi:hypothetical protein